MRRIAAWISLAVALAATESMAQAVKRDVVLSLSLPGGANPQLRITDGETGSVELPKVGKFGFVPTLRADSDTVVVELFDLNTTPRKRIDRMEMVQGGDYMQSATTPSIGVRVTRIIE